MVGVQAPPTVQTDVATQLICRMKVQAPLSGAQQVPFCGCGQGFVGVHDAPWVQTVSAAVHWNCAFCVQAPVPALQHVPVGGTKQGLVGVQDCPTVQTLAAAQFTWKVPVQTPSWVQHEPDGGCGQGLVGVQV